MARMRSSRGKEREKDAGDSGVENVKQLLPERIFATDHFPSEMTNFYSKTDLLLRVRDALKGSPEWLVLLLRSVHMIQESVHVDTRKCSCEYKCLYLGTLYVCV
ncbi:hypothetical protein Rs2_27752 [Raphanus sativus]|nr:hypothetical protein Rs2_27752 [Raphanus sativus]